MYFIKGLETLKKISDKLNGNYISMEDLYILYFLNAKNENGGDKELIRLINWYFKSYIVYAANSKFRFIIPVKQRIDYLIDLDLIKPVNDDWYNTETDGSITINFNYLNCTDFFIKEIFEEKPELLFRYFLDEVLDEDNYEVNGTLQSHTFISSEARKAGFYTTEDLQKRFWKFCDYGSKQGVNTFFESVKWYINKYQKHNIALWNLLIQYPSEILPKYEKSKK